MREAARCVVFLILLFLTSCRQSKTEKEEVSYWNQAVVDSSFQLLFKDKDTSRALHYFDSAAKNLTAEKVYPKAQRFALKANYFYFFTADNSATARMIDSTLALFPTAELQNRYPRTYVGFLLFGGNIAYRLNEYSKANEYYFRAKNLAEAHLSPCEQTPFFYSIAMVLYRQENFNASLQYFKQAYSLQESCPQTTAVILQQQEIQSNIGLCYVHLNEDDSAMIHFDKALALANHYKDSLGPAVMDKIHGVIYGNKAKVLLYKNRLAEAEQLSLKAIALNDRPGYEMEFAQTIKLQLADIYSRKKNFASMISLLKTMEAGMPSLTNSQRLEWRRLMADYYEQGSHPQLAISYLKSYFSLNDSLAAEQQLLTAADVARQLKDKEQQLQIAMLTKGKEKAILSLWVAVLFFCMAVVIIYLIYQNYRRSKKNLAALQVLHEEIKIQKAAREAEENKRHKLITEAVIEAQENERSVIGLELHDNINQVLTTVKLQNEMVLEGIGDPAAILPRSIKYLQDCINEIRSLSKRLSAPTLGKISLEESVGDLIESINLTSKVKITYQISGFRNGALNKELHIGLYRILQEQLHNVLKHAEASEVLVQLKQEQGAIRLSVIDNGKGFVLNSRNTGIGLVNMQTRAENLNGTFQLESQPGKGCKVKVVLPCLQ